MKFPKPKDLRMPSQAFKTMPDGREVILPTAAGRRLKAGRRHTAWLNSAGVCCLCEYPVNPYDATLEHLTSKGMGGSKHDDRQENLGISHLAGNVAKGSQSLEQYLKLPIEVRRRNCGQNA